jgi:surfactin synthase thioesterase subunit
VGGRLGPDGSFEIPIRTGRLKFLSAVGILFGRHDAILNYQDHGTAMQSKIKGSTVSLVDGGHMLPITAPDETARWITEFARRSALIEVETGTLGVMENEPI